MSLGTPVDVNRDFDKKERKIVNRMANGVDPDEMARYEPSHQDLHCLLRYILSSSGLNYVNIPVQIYYLDSARF